VTQPLFDHLPDVAARIGAAGRVFLFLDFDGTLAPIVEDPDMAQMPAGTRDAMRNLAGKENLSVGIISGRALRDVQERVGLKDIIYAGNHGLEISGPGLSLVNPTAAMRVELLRELAQDLQNRLLHIPGILVENKVLTASVHFRRAPASSLDEIRQAVGAAVDSTGDLFCVTPGLEVLEIKPRVNWNKGSAVRWIEDKLDRGPSLTVFVGDDITDEDAFAALPDGITVRVGPHGKTSARYHLPTQESVPALLGWLANATAFSLETSRCGSRR
jgi:trehalose 6-phosphate phosphatase